MDPGKESILAEIQVNSLTAKVFDEFSHCFKLCGLSVLCGDEYQTVEEKPLYWLVFLGEFFPC